MATSILDKLRKSRGTTLANLASKTDAEEKSYAKDDRIWSYELDKTGSATAELRFLPAVGEDDLPWVKMFTHGFKGPSGKWYIENSRTTIGEDDPVVESNTELWETGIESNKKLVSEERKRRATYYSNVLIIKDPAHPENEGKVFLFKYGKMIFDLIMSSIRPEFDDVDPVNVFDIDEGANLKLRIYKKDGYVKYDKCAFSKTSALCDGDEDKMSEVLEKAYSLSEIISPDKFKSYDELKVKLASVLGTTSQSATKMPTPKDSPMKYEKEVSSSGDSQNDAEIDDFFKSLSE